MTRYVIADEGQIKDVRELDEQWVATVRANGNPKASRIFDILPANRPVDTASQFAQESFTLSGNAYQQVWTMVTRPMPTITRFQLRAAIRGLNRRADFITYIRTTATEADQDYWETSERYVRTDPEVERARVALGVSQNAMNNLFYSAGAL